MFKTSPTGKLYKDAHDVLSVLVTLGKWTTKRTEAGIEALVPLGYIGISVKHIAEVLNFEFGYVIDILKILSKDDNANIHQAQGEYITMAASSTFNGERAYKQGYYLEKKFYEDANYQKAWKEKNWFWIALISWLIGVAMGILIPIALNKLQSGNQATSKIVSKQVSVEKDSTKSHDSYMKK